MVISASSIPVSATLLISLLLYFSWLSILFTLLRREIELFILYLYGVCLCISKDSLKLLLKQRKDNGIPASRLGSKEGMSVALKCETFILFPHPHVSVSGRRHHMCRRSFQMYGIAPPASTLQHTESKSNSQFLWYKSFCLLHEYSFNTQVMLSRQHRHANAARFQPELQRTHTAGNYTCLGILDKQVLKPIGV